MRERLQSIEMETISCAGIYVRSRTIYKSGNKIRLFLVKNVWNQEGTYLTDHVWAELSKGVELTPGDIFTFTADVESYIRFGNWRTEKLDVDYTLKKVRNVHILSSTNPEIKEEREIQRLTKMKERTPEQTNQLKQMRYVVNERNRMRNEKAKQKAIKFNQPRQKTSTLYLMNPEKAVKTVPPHQAPPEKVEAAS